MSQDNKRLLLYLLGAVAIVIAVLGVAAYFGWKLLRFVFGHGG